MYSNGEYTPKRAEFSKSFNDLGHIFIYVLIVLIFNYIDIQYE